MDVRKFGTVCILWCRDQVRAEVLALREEVAAAAEEVGDLRDQEEARAASAAVHYRQEVSVF